MMDDDEDYEEQDSDSIEVIDIKRKPDINKEDEIKIINEKEIFTDFVKTILFLNYFI